MATITSTGLGSGLDVESIVSKLVSIEKQPITALQTRTDTIKTQISAYGKIQSAFSAMRDAASKLTTPASWAALTATSSDASMATVTASTGSGAGSYAVSVTNLAAAQSLSSQAYTSTAAVGAGSLTIELGQWSADNSTFTGKGGTSPVSVTIGASDTLSTVRDKINSSGAGVLASVVTDASGSRLVIRSKDTGVENGFRITAADADGNNGDATGLSALAYDPTASVASLTRNVAAANANLTINGLDISSATNSIESAVDGLSINLLKKGDLTVTVGQDKDAVKKVVTDFVTAYNSLMTMLRDNTKYDESSKSAGALQGDSTAVSLQAQLRNITSSGSTLGGSFARLADIGLNIGSNGLITVDNSKLTSAMGHISDVKQLFMGVDNTNADNSGIAQRWRKFADQVLSVDGSITTRTSGLQSRVTANTKRSDEMTDRAAAYEKRVRAQYTALDTQMAKLNDMSSYVSKITSMLSSSS
ncbi:flagellar filament capping protein FliD [Roseateles amylovorans]|jgi:flagellar hook-associated protein 2|uniref:Flagellar hook-associated protein 2 n=1 Tax=Roseateles amylovorans TaxID=2978473 RepID=A0ABY6B3M5_9BURK|nr:flagellar filament capping protein FliD [Roseateles amylovorans]UXH79794.1 flagellar filament capping protein FliD [Roseateles amylovorans]